jgi:hypothetical protein
MNTCLNCPKRIQKKKQIFGEPLLCPLDAVISADCLSGESPNSAKKSISYGFRVKPGMTGLPNIKKEQ